MNKALLFCMLLLTGCATGKVDVPASLMQKCPELFKLEGMSGEHLIKNITLNAKVYHDCADGKAALIEAVKTK